MDFAGSCSFSEKCVCLESEIWNLESKIWYKTASLRENGWFMKCVVCEQKKGKRQCPAKNALICASCCGEKRVLEIACPETCDYLKAGRERDAEDFRKRVQRMDAASRERYRRVLSDHEDVIARLEIAIARASGPSRDLKDQDVVRAVDVLLETYRTEDKGVLYERTSDDLRVESLRRELRTIIESFRNPEANETAGIVDPQTSRLQLGGAIECLELVRSLAMAYLQDHATPAGYVDFLVRVIPREEARSSIILP